LIYTVGHSTRSVEELIEILAGAEVGRLVDVRSVPASRRHPHFERGALESALHAHGIDYRHERALGGFRRPLVDSPNDGWEHAAFRGYADYMATAEFRAALERLETWATERRSCVMCAEAAWWRCHRRLIADALLVRGWSVRHLGLRAQPPTHELTAFAVRGPGDALTYPAVREAM